MFCTYTIICCLHTCVFSLSLSSPLSHINSLFLHMYTLHFTVICCIVGKGKVHPRICHKGPEGELRCSSTLPLISALDGGGSSTPCPGRFTPKKDPVPIVQEAGWAPGLVRTDAENLIPTGSCIVGNIHNSGPPEIPTQGDRCRNVCCNIARLVLLRYSVYI